MNQDTKIISFISASIVLHAAVFLNVELELFSGKKHEIQYNELTVSLISQQVSENSPVSEIEQLKPIEPKNIPEPDIIEKKTIEQKTTKEQLTTKKSELIVEKKQKKVNLKPKKSVKAKAHQKPVQRQTDKNTTVIIKKEFSIDNSTKIKELENQYMQYLIGKIQNVKSYPRAARRRHIEGQVTIFFTILQNGNILNIEVAESAKNKILDRDAIKTIKKIKPLKPYPKEIGRKTWEIKVPIMYELN